MASPAGRGRAILALCLVLPWPSLAAQSRSSWLLGAGLAVPTGELNTYANNGWAVTGGFEHRFGDHPVAIRLDLTYASTGDTSGIGFQETTRLITAMANIVYHFNGSSPHIYALLGVGLFARRFSSEDPDDLPIRDSQLGLQVGEGVTFRVRSVTAFVEGRFSETLGMQRLEYFPIAVGVRLGSGRP